MIRFEWQLRSRSIRYKEATSDMKMKEAETNAQNEI